MQRVRYQRQLIAKQENSQLFNRRKDGADMIGHKADYIENYRPIISIK